MPGLFSEFSLQFDSQTEDSQTEAQQSESDCQPSLRDIPRKFHDLSEQHEQQDGPTHASIDEAGALNQSRPIAAEPAKGLSSAS
jgi:hypothetical protein